MFFQVEGVQYVRERLELQDGDFLDLDWRINSNNRKLVILSHGLEGNSGRHYIMRPAKFFFEQGYDILAWNCRGCSGEINRLPKTYQHGDVEDIGAVVDVALSKGYENIFMIGFSMGGNMTLKYLGTKGDRLDKRLVAAAVFSVPCHLEDSSNEINKKGNRFYEKRFIRKLRAKLEVKAEKIPELAYDWSQINNFHDFNLAYTLPVYGFQSEMEFLEQARTDHLLPAVHVPTLLVNALNDPMLAGRNYPVDSAEEAKNVWLEMPNLGGHVGFTQVGQEFSYMEYRAKAFFAGKVE